MHNFNMGIGGDLAAGSLMAACHMSIFGYGSFEKRLDRAHDSFDTWCRENHKTPSIKSFEKKKFKVKTLLVNHISSILGYLKLWGVYFIVLWSPLFPALPARNSDFPQGTGRAHDTALLCKWMGWELGKLDAYDVVLWRVLRIVFQTPNQNSCNGHGCNTIQVGTQPP